jgi:phosphoribosylaminoimidazolecarboxamide formyltransferase/IMP cyclohydrolase
MEYKKVRDLKYGQNPHQNGAEFGIVNGECPLKFLNGNPGIVNAMEAVRGYKLVRALDVAFDMPAAAVLKHKNPAGAAIAVPLDDVMRRTYFCEDKKLSKLSTAYLRADGTDPKSAYGGTIALSREVDVPTALAIRPRVVDVVVAPAYQEEAFNILKEKKDGKLVIATFNPNYAPSKTVVVREDDIEFRFNRNDYTVNDALLEDVVGAPLTAEEKRDIKVGVVIAKYTKSNKTIYVLDGQSAGIMPCQQSRVDSMRWAGDKAVNWLFRQSQRVESIDVSKLKLYDKIEKQTGDITKMFDGKTSSGFSTRTEIIRDTIRDMLKYREKGNFNAVTCGFLPFEDCVTEAYNHGVGTIAYPKAPGKGIRFENVAESAKSKNMKLCLFPYRLFEET